MNLTEELKYKIVNVLELEGVDPASIDDDTSFFRDGLGIDSIDLLELVMMIESDYGVSIMNREDGEKAFVTIATLSQFIENRRS